MSGDKQQSWPGWSRESQEGAVREGSTGGKGHRVGAASGGHYGDHAKE